ncbi:PREDICTED: pentatricopeptide repeat-containing protein At4g38150 isoform X1 [Camelina sativa]|uniref:Pentatricopeptide repeat-containing protein At4g38150 isoform X1 n=1 Tax=Camelina sativa TaxID=90675 RepID=A0ABM0TBE7_CAMSA|nr:PREDICTED: pentatricopeptide repeat-containing protein At4g38150 isoform X1 [Camelina sativa]
MAVRLARSLVASSSSLRSYFSLGNRSSASDITSSEVNGGDRAFAFYSSSSSWWSSPEDLTAGSKRREKKTTDRFSAVIDAVHDRKLPPELRGRRDFVRSKLNSNSLFPWFCGGVFTRQFSSETKRVNTKVNFSLSNDDSDEETPVTRDSGKPELPPPYDPFSKKLAIEEPEDPKNLQEIFHKMRTEGFTNEAVKMFDALSKDGLTHEALELFSQIKDKNQMPEVVAHTAIVEAYANAGQAKEALKVFMRMLSCGVSPNAYTYTVLIKGLAGDARTLKDAKKYLLEMMGIGMSPNAATYTPVFEAFVKEGKEESARELLQEMKGKGFVPDEKAVREALQSKRGQVFRTVINVLFDK